MELASLPFGSGVGVSFFFVCGMGLAVILRSAFDKSVLNCESCCVRNFVISVMIFSFPPNLAIWYLSPSRLEHSKAEV